MILSRTSLVGLAVGATAGLSLVAFILYRECNRRGRRNRSSRTAKVFGWNCWNRTPWDKYQTQDADLQVLPSVEAVVQGLSPAQQLELRNQLDQVRNFVSTLRLEVAELSRGLQNIATQIIQDVRKGVGENHRGPRWPHLVHREQEDSSGSSSSNLTASRAVASTFTNKINRCYSAVYADSNSDNDTDGEELETEADADVQMQQGMMAIQTDDIEMKPQVTWLGVERKLEMVLEDVGLPCSSSQVLHNQPQMQKEQTSPARVLRMLVKDPKADTSLLLAHSRAARLWDKNSN